MTDKGSKGGRWGNESSLGFQVKLGLFKNSLDRRDYKYFSNLKHFSTSLMEDHSISDDDIEIFTNHLGNLQDDFGVRFKDLENMTIPEWIITPFDVKFENRSVEPECEYELAELSMDIAAKFVFESRSLSDFWYNVNTRDKYPKLAAAAEPFLLTFPSSYMVEAGFSHVNAILSKQRNRLNLEEWGDLRLKLTNIQPNVNALVRAHQAHPSH